MDMKYLCYLILVRKDLSTSLCIRYSKSGSKTLFVPMSELFSPEGKLDICVQLRRFDEVRNTDELQRFSRTLTHIQEVLCILNQEQLSQ